MTIESKSERSLAALQLRKDAGFYCAGGVPSDDELARAPEIAGWYVMHRTKQGEPTLDRFMSICGRVDSEAVRTSAVVWFDRHRRFVRTVNRLYRLGEPAGNQVTGEDG